MKYIKIPGLLAVAAAALLVFAGTASATAHTSPAGTTYTAIIKATSSNTVLHGAFTSVSCATSSFEGKVEAHGATAVSCRNSGRGFCRCKNGEVTVRKAVHRDADGNEIGFGGAPT
jgi:ribosomal protein S27E